MRGGNSDPRPCWRYSLLNFADCMACANSICEIMAMRDLPRPRSECVRRQSGPDRALRVKVSLGPHKWAGQEFL